MTHRFAPLLLGALALLGGCAASPQPMDGAAHLGTWIVTDAFASGAVADAASAPRGQTVPMEAARAGDAAAGGGSRRGGIIHPSRAPAT